MNHSAQIANRQIRVFISSTFRDMQAERDILIKKIFPQLRKLCEQRAVTWTEVDLRWGIRDEDVAEGKVLPLCLEEIQRCRPHFIGLLGERYGSLPREIPAELLERQKWLEQHRDKSITELEIIHGVLRDEEMHGHAYFYFRDPKYLERVPKDKRSDFTAENEKTTEKLERLKKEIRRARDEQVCQLRESFSDPEELGEWILDDFSTLIERLYPKDQTPHPLDQEAARHEAYARSRRLAFVGRDDLLRRLDEHWATPGRPLVLTGESGCGKSALLAEWVARWRNEHPDDLIIQHYIGSTPDSADWQRLVRRILEELRRAFDITDDLPTTPDALRNALNTSTTKAAGARRVVLVLDALNQLADDGAAKHLGWLPVVFPNNFHVLVSTLKGESLEVLRQRKCEIQEVPLFKPEEILTAITAFFEPFGRRQLPKETLVALASSTAALNPLYLRAVLDELRQFGDNAKLKAKAADYLSAPDLPELFDRILTRWHDDFGKDPERPDFVRRSLCLIACARFGLAEAELLDLLGNDSEPMPRRPWTPFYLAAENALALHSGLLNFGHDHLRAAVQKRWLGDNETIRTIHLELADYFQSCGIEPRSVVELPWQLCEAQIWHRLHNLLAAPDGFVSVWVTSESDMLRYWSRLEAESPYRAAEAYRDAASTPHPWGATETTAFRFLVADFLKQTGNLELAASLYQLLIDCYRASGDDAMLERCLGNYAGILHDFGKVDEAEAMQAEAQMIAKRSGDLKSYAIATAARGSIFFDRGRYEEADQMYEEAERIRRDMDDRQGLAFVLGNRAGIRAKKGDLSGAMTLLREQQQIGREAGAEEIVAASLLNEGWLHVQKGQIEEASRCYSEAERIARDLGLKELFGRCLLKMASIAEHRNRFDEALELLIQAEAAFRQIGHTACVRDAVGNQGVVHLFSRRFDDALRCYHESESISRQLRDEAGVATALGNQAIVFWDKGDGPKALSLLQDAERICRELGDVHGVIFALFNQARINRALNNFTEAAEQISGCQALAKGYELRRWQDEIEKFLNS